MTNEAGAGAEPYLVGGNLLNEQDNVLRAKQQHDAAQEQAPAEKRPDEDQPASGNAPDDPETITEEQQTHGGGFVPPGSDGGTRDAGEAAGGRGRDRDDP